MSLLEKFRHPKGANLVEPPLEDFEDREGQKDWAGLWSLKRYDMVWWRPEHFYRRSARTGRVIQQEQLHRGPAVRPGPLALVGSIEAPLAVLRSHPEAPDSLPERLEGKWTDTNPAFPEISIDMILGDLGLVAVWGETSSDITETYELVPGTVEGVDPDEIETFDPTPRILTAPLIYARPGTPPTKWTREIQVVTPGLDIPPMQVTLGPHPYY